MQKLATAHNSHAYQTATWLEKSIEEKYYEWGPHSHDVLHATIAENCRCPYHQCVQSWFFFDFIFIWSSQRCYGGCFFVYWPFAIIIFIAVVCLCVSCNTRRTFSIIGKLDYMINKYWIYGWKLCLLIYYWNGLFNWRVCDLLCAYAHTVSFATYEDCIFSPSFDYHRQIE